MRNRNHHRRGFTMIELIIVIAIIAILVGIVLSVGATLAASQNIKRTQATMQILESALDEYEALMRRELTWGIDQSTPPPGSVYAARYDIQEDTMHVFLISDMLKDVSRSSDIRSMLANIDGERYLQIDQVTQPAWIKEGSLPSFLLTEPDPDAAIWETDASRGLPAWRGQHTVLDAWERPIRVIHPGRKWTDADLLPGPDEDGTVRTPLEDLYGEARNAKPYFVSAGPDGRFGDIDPAPSDPNAELKLEANSDNIYSYEVE